MTLIQQNPVQGLTQLSADIGGLVSDEVGHVGEFLSAFPEVYRAAADCTARVDRRRRGTGRTGRNSDPTRHR